MICQHCGNENREGALFCSQCGKPLEIKEEVIEEIKDDEEEIVENKQEEVVEEIKEEPIIEEKKEQYYCQYCHSEIYESTIICPHCGSLLKKGVPVYLNIEDKSNIGLNILSLINPLIGIFGYLIFKNYLPKLTKAMRNFALIGLSIILLLAIVVVFANNIVKDTCHYTTMDGQRCQEEVYKDGLCPYHYTQQNNSFFQYF